MKLSSFKSPSEHHCPWESDSFFFWNPPFMFFTWVHLLLPWHVLAPWRGESGKMPLKPLPSGIICAWRNIRNAKEQEPGGRAGLGEVLWSAGVRGLCPHCRIHGVEIRAVGAQSASWGCTEGCIYRMSQFGCDPKWKIPLFGALWSLCHVSVHALTTQWLSYHFPPLVLNVPIICDEKNWHHPSPIMFFSLQYFFLTLQLIRIFLYYQQKFSLAVWFLEDHYPKCCSG